MSFEIKLKNWQNSVENLLDSFLAPPSSDSTLEEAMRYSVLNGGKRLRACLVYATAESLGLPLTHVDPAAAAIECFHAYSLIHDDLPSMDNDDWRRGKPTCHKRFGEATAILAGDALQSFAFELLAKQEHLSAEICLKQIRSLSTAGGYAGMAGGQALDLALSGQCEHTTKALLERLHTLKTGALLSCALELALLASETNPHPWKTSLSCFAKTIGLAFQIQDDILDGTESKEVLGKTAGKDALANKPTFVTILGLSAAKLAAKELLSKAQIELKALGPTTESLSGLSNYIIERVY
jgi:farnesyl diphosphate synthase